MSQPSKIIKLMKQIKSTRMWIDGKCFNISKHEDKDVCSTEATNESSMEEYKVNYDINNTDDLYHSSFRLPSIYYKKIEEVSDFNVKDLEEHTNASIKIPQCGSDDCIVISSKNIESVIDARSKLHSVFSLIREKQRPLQFISIPIINDNIKTKFEHFKNEVLADGKIDGLHESIFQKSERLHLTVGVLSLLDDLETTEGIKVLDECKNKIINPIIFKNGPLKIKVSGLECMNDNYNKVNILYANAKICSESDEDILQNIANLVQNYFFEKGLLRQSQENVKIHVTLMNTKYRKSEGRKRKWRDSKKPFNASRIMEKYKDYHFGECHLKEVHLSWISKIDENGFYKPLSKIST